MLFSFSSKMVMGMALLLTVSIQSLYAAPPPPPTKADLFKAFMNSGPHRGPRPTCPNEYLVNYKDCKGELQQCSTCLGIAEQKCRTAAKAKGVDDIICSHCTSSVNGKCNGIKEMCFGDQECNKKGPDHQCINYECIYVQPK